MDYHQSYQSQTSIFLFKKLRKFLNEETKETHYILEDNNTNHITQNAHQNDWTLDKQTCGNSTRVHWLVVCVCMRVWVQERESPSSKECYIQFSTKIIEKLNQQRIKSSYKPLEVSKKPSKLINLSSDSSQNRTNFTRKSVTLQFLGFVLDKHFRKPSKLINLSTDSSQKTEHQFHKKNPLSCSF